MNLGRHKYKLLPAALAVIAIVLVAVFWAPLRGWFALPSPGGSASGPHAAHGAAPPSGASAAAAPEKPKRTTAKPLPETKFSEPVLDSLGTAFEAYETIRVALVQDTLEGTGPAGARLATALRAAAQGVTDAPAAKERIESGAKLAEHFEHESDLDRARKRYSQLSEVMVALAAADQRLMKERHVFECPMVDDFNKWVQPTQKLENPYMGQKMLACGSESTWVPPAAAEHVEHAHGGDPSAVAHYTCPMHPSVKQPDAGKCPICGMDLVPVTQQELKSGVVRVDAARRQLIGVKTAVVGTRAVERTLRTVGRITYDETRMAEVSLKFKGWVGTLYANATGKKIRRGQTLFTVYSPEIYAAQEELLLAMSTRRAFDGGAARTETLVDAAKLRLRLWDVSQGTIDKVVKDQKPMRYVPIASPASGYIVEKNVFDGSAVEPGMKLLRIANLDKVWIEAELYEAELPLVPVGHEAKVTLSYLPGKEFTGKVTFVYPYLDGSTRTGRVRIELINEKVELKPDMYANVELSISRGEQLVVPDSAVIYAGPRRIVFVDLGQDRLKPREIEVGLRFGDHYEVLSGLQAGEKVVTSGNFLIAADSRLKSAAEMWR